MKKMKPVKAWAIVDSLDRCLHIMRKDPNSMHGFAEAVGLRLARVQIQELSPKKRGKAK